MNTRYAAESLKFPGKSDGRGRTRTITKEDRRRLAELIREHGIGEAQRRAKVAVSINTLIKSGREFGIKLPHGLRRSRRTAG